MVKYQATPCVNNSVSADFRSSSHAIALNEEGDALKSSMNRRFCALEERMTMNEQVIMDECTL